MAVPRVWISCTRINCILVVAVIAFLGSIPLVSIADRQTGARDSLWDPRHGPGIANHPVNVIPSDAVRVPEAWPLGPDGTITCLTCHLRIAPVEGSAKASLRDFDENRVEPGRFCVKCHIESDRPTARTMHWMAIPFAHITAETDQSGLSDAALDGQSIRCLACHDGVSAAEARNPTPWNPGQGHSWDRRLNHPIGVRYPVGRPRRNGTQFRPAGLLPKEIRLPGGRVSCVSCHNLYAGEQRLLTVPIRESRLCLTCHNL